MIFFCQINSAEPCRSWAGWNNIYSIASPLCCRPANTISLDFQFPAFFLKPEKERKMVYKIMLKIDCMYLERFLFDINQSCFPKLFPRFQVMSYLSYMSTIFKDPHHTLLLKCIAFIALSICFLQELFPRFAFLSYLLFKVLGI